MFRKDSATLGTNPKVYVKIPSADKFSDFYDKSVAENHITTQVSFEEGDDAIWNFLVSFGPILLIIVVWIFYRMMRGYASGGYVGNAASPASVSTGGVMVNMGGVYISSSNEQQSTQRSAIDSNGILKQLKPAIISVVSEQAQRPGTPLWKAIKEGR